MDRANYIGVIFVATIDTHKLGLCQSVLFGDMPAARTRSARVVWWHSNEHSAIPAEFVLQPDAEPLTWSLVFARGQEELADGWSLTVEQGQSRFINSKLEVTPSGLRRIVFRSTDSGNTPPDMPTTMRDGVAACMARILAARGLQWLA